MLAGLYPGIVLIWVLLTFSLGLFFGFNSNSRIKPYVFASYLAGMELLGRMSGSGLPHEFTKYAVIVILSLAIAVNRMRMSILFVLFVLLLVPAAFLTDGGNFEATRQLISANLSGPVCLAVSVIYFNNVKLTIVQISKIFLSLLFPLAAIIGYLFIRTPDFSEIEFGFQSNFAASVYGPNQMASMLGLGVLVIATSYFLGIRLFSSVIITWSFLGLLLFRGLLTFSRGGMISSAILIALMFLYLSWKEIGLNLRTLRIMTVAAGILLVSYLAFDYTNRITKNALLERYTGIQRGRQIEDVDKLTSARTLIVVLDWKIFLDNPLTGIGVGMGKFERTKYGNMLEAAAHNEFSRLLSEHGLAGIVCVLILIYAGTNRFFSTKSVSSRILVLAGVGFCLIFMTHSATRLAAPSFMYGLAFAEIVRSTRLKG
jgi:hypothetical protein